MTKVPATTADEARAAPTAGAPEARRVRGMFDRIAGRYDLLNHLLSMQQDRLWRLRAARRAVEGFSGPSVLDLCTGTGDLARAIQRADRRARVVGADFSLGMLERAAAKDRSLRLAGVDAHDLPFAAGCFDVATVAFGVRNWTDRARGFAEARRVLREGGRLVVLEFAPPPATVLGRIYRVYSQHVLPRVAGLIARDPAAYRYLPDSVERFPPPPALAAELAAAGFRSVECELLAFGTVALHRARR